MSNRISNELLRCEKEKLILVEIALKYGLSDPRTIAQSEKVGSLINKVMERMLANSTNNCYGLPLNSYIGFTGTKVIPLVFTETIMFAPGLTAALLPRIISPTASKN